jgi:hypothetical protein
MIHPLVEFPVNMIVFRQYPFQGADMGGKFKRPVGRLPLLSKVLTPDTKT